MTPPVEMLSGTFTRQRLQRECRIHCNASVAAVIVRSLIIVVRSPGFACADFAMDIAVPWNEAKGAIHLDSK